MSSTGFPRPPPDPNVYFGQPIIPVGTVTIILTTLFVGMRFWSRVVILRAVALEDGFMFCAWLFAIGTSIANCIQLNYGLGRQYAVLDVETRTNNLKLGLATNVIYFFALLFVKISVLCLYIRVLTYDYVRLAAKIMLGIVGITHAWIIASIFTGCIPLDALWNRTKDRGNVYCHSGDVYWSHAGINIITDFLISLLPLLVLHKLHIPRRQKIALYCVFLLGFSVCVISILRTVQFIRILFINPTSDTTQDGVIIAIWTMCEVNLAVICACIPTIKPALVHIFPRFLSSDPRRTDDSGPWSGAIEQAHDRPHRLSDDDGDAAADAELATHGYKGSEQSSGCTENIGLADLHGHGSGVGQNRVRP